MADNEKQQLDQEQNNTTKGASISSSEASQKAAQGLQILIERIKELPAQQRLMLLGAVLLILMALFTGEGEQPQPQQNKNVVAVNNPQQSKQSSQSRQSVKLEEEEAEDSRENVFAIEEISGEVQVSKFVEQQRLLLTDLRDEMQKNLEKKEDDLKEIEDAIGKQSLQMQQMIDTFNAQMRAFEASNSRYRDEMAKVLKESKANSAINTPGAENYKTRRFAEKDKRIQQHLLGGGGGGVSVNPNQALLNINGTPIKKAVGSKNKNIKEVPEPNPFLPPLGFVRGVMLNGVDALSGVASPSLVRLSGTYKTAMNSSVTLDGCIAFVEFEADVSTERAVGKPSKMTCVYPDKGAVVYTLSGYVVNPQDGIVGIPGIFFEGDASRIAAVMTAEFVSGMMEILKDAQQTSEAGASGGGETVTNITGSSIKAQLGEGASKALISLTSFLEERSNRVVPFVRVDATREISLVLLEGFELRKPHNANPWTMLVDGESLDTYRLKKREAERLLENSAKQDQQKGKPLNYE